MKTYLYNYKYRGGRYSLEIPADSKEEADARMDAIQYGRVGYDGELVAKIPATFYGTGPLVRFVTWLRNWIRM
jgi:hypothetical protein